MKIFVKTDENGRITAAADYGFHLGATEVEAEFSDDLVHDGHVDIYDDRMIPLYRYSEGKAVARTQEDMDADYTPPAESPGEDGDLAAQVASLKTQVHEQAELLASYEAAYMEGVNEA